MTTVSKSPSTSRTAVAFWVLAVVLVAVGAGVWSTRGNEAGASAGEGGKRKGTLHLETFVLNLADPGQRSYLRVGIDLGLAREMGRRETTPVGEVRDTILGVLAESRVEELLTAQGKTKLKAGLLHALQERVPVLGVEEVYFTEFLIQR
jgi:flagellar basal body-associated protein FliL